MEAASCTAALWALCAWGCAWGWVSAHAIPYLQPGTSGVPPKTQESTKEALFQILLCTPSTWYQSLGMLTPLFCETTDSSCPGHVMGLQ